MSSDYPVLDKRILLVGNGPGSIKTLRDGIDTKYDLIVRFNRFQTTGYEGSIGSRTHLWALNNAQNVHSRVRNTTHQEFENIEFLLSPTPSEKIMKRTFGVVKKAFPDSKIYTIPAQNKKNLNKRVSVGLLTINYFINHLKHPIDICGFDGIQNNGNTGHYFEDKGDRGRGVHEPDLEREIMINFKASGMIKEI